MKQSNLLSGLLVLFLLSSISLPAQKRWWAGHISGNGPVVEQTIDLSSFEKISLGISANLYIRQGDTQSITIKGQQNIIDNIIEDVSDNTWRIRFDRPVRRSEGLKIYVTVPKLSSMRVSGSGNVYGENKFDNSDTFYAGISGSGNMKMQIQTQDLISKVSGSGNINLSGQSETSSVQISGSGNIKASELSSKRCNVRISGSGDAKVDVVDQLDVRISGSGDVSYKGSPRINSKISGSGKVSSGGV